MTIKESVLRDHLKERLDMIEDGLQLVDDEFYLRNNIGTSGFVDILARDLVGRLVIIEIKVSKHSEREAITELFKYIALLKQNMAIKDSEIKVIVISTDWRELLVPFSEFHWNTAYDSSGLLADVDEGGFPLNLSVVKLPEKSSGRKLVPRHWLQVYRSKDNRDASALEYGEKIQARGIDNFVIANFCFDYYGPRQYGFYFAQQEENLELYKKILFSVSKERFDEISEYTSDFTDNDDILNEFADAAVDMISVEADELEIGHPEKIKGYLEKEWWNIEEIIRFGTFSNDIRLTDEQIIQDLCGFTGDSHTWYFSASNYENTAHIHEITERYSGCLYHNDVWRHAIRDYIDYFTSKGTHSNFLLSIFNPENILETIYLISKYNDLSYLPNFQLVIENTTDNEMEIFEGFINYKGIMQKDLNEIVNEYFAGDSSNILMYGHLHGIAELNQDIMSDLGLGYSIKYCKVKNGIISDEGVTPVVRGQGISISQAKNNDNLIDWMKQNNTVTQRIHRIYDSGIYNGFDAICNGEQLVSE